jgi:Ala-tRNA(Pro) deacylase
MNTNATYQRLIAILNDAGADYRLIDHAPEGQTEVVSLLRGHGAHQAVKCIIMIAKLGRKTTRYILGVVPGDRRISLAKVKALLGATYIGFASKDDAERLGGSVIGTILPFCFDASLDLVVDPSVQEIDTIFFNAALLERSIGLKTGDYFAIARPSVDNITE